MAALVVDIGRPSWHALSLVGGARMDSRPGPRHRTVGRHRRVVLSRRERVIRRLLVWRLALTGGGA